MTFWTVLYYHDNQKGNRDRVNGILCLDFNGVKVVRLGDIGYILEQEYTEAIGNVYVLLIPVDEHFTINAETKRTIVGQLNPKIIIPMNYMTYSLKRDLCFSDEKNFKKKFKNMKILKKKSLNISKKDIKDELQVIAMKYFSPE